jgi:hypothetical protein
MTTWICLEDVVRVLNCRHFTAEAQARAVQLLGFDWDVPVPPLPPSLPDREPAPEPPSAPVRPPQSEDVPPPERRNEAWIDRLTRPVSAGRPGWYEQVRTLEPDTAPSDLPPSRVAPLFPPASQRALLISMLSKLAPGREIDVSRLVDRVASREVFSKLPLRRRLSTSGGVQVLLDVSDRMEPFAQDQSQLIESLRRQIPENRLEVLHCDGAPPDRARQAKHGYRYPPRGTLVLLVGDVGQGGGPFSPRSPKPELWVAFAHRLAVQGCEFLVLAPLSPDQIDRATADRIEIIPWDRRFSGAAVRRYRRHQGSD